MDLEEECSPASKIGCNSVVVHVIASLSDFATLKSLRLVSSFWLQAVSRAFTQRSCVVLCHRTTERSLLSFKKDTKELELKALKIHCNFETRLKSIEESAINDILQHLQPSLVLLELAPQNHYSSILFKPKFNGQFPVLRSLVLANLGYDSLRIVPELFAAMPRLENLELSQLEKVLSPLYFTKEDGSIHRNNLAPNLRSLTVKYALGTIEAERLAAFPQTWEALELGWCSHHDAKVATALEQLLERNKDTLLSFLLSDVTHPEGSSCPCCSGSPTQVQLKFPPSFSKLKKLELLFVGRDFDHLGFSFGENRDLQEFSGMCPMLQLAQIDVCIKTELKGFWSKFFPEFMYRDYNNRLNWICWNARYGRRVNLRGRSMLPPETIKSIHKWSGIF